ncbi:hypothetical protein EVA_10877, partial [gut metagenome]
EPRMRSPENREFPTREIHRSPPVQNEQKAL